MKQRDLDSRDRLSENSKNIIWCQIASDKSRLRQVINELPRQEMDFRLTGGETCNHNNISRNRKGKIRSTLPISFLFLQQNEL